MELPAATKPTNDNFVRVMKKNVQWIKVVTNDSKRHMFFWNYIFLTFWNFRHRLVRLYWYLLIIFFVLLIFIILDHINTSSPNSAASHLSHCFRYNCAFLLDIWIGLHVLPAFFLQVNIFRRKKSSTIAWGLMGGDSFSSLGKPCWIFVSCWLFPGPIYVLVATSLHRPDS